MKIHPNSKTCHPFHGSTAYRNYPQLTGRPSKPSEAVAATGRDPATVMLVQSPVTRVPADAYPERGLPSVLRRIRNRRGRGSVVRPVGDIRKKRPSLIQYLAAIHSAHNEVKLHPRIRLHTSPSKPSTELLKKLLLIISWLPESLSRTRCCMSCTICRHV